MQLVVLLPTDSSGQLDRTELRKLVELMSKGPTLARFGGARRTIARVLLHLTRCCGLCTHCDDVRSRKPSLSRCRSSVGGRARCSDVRDGRLRIWGYFVQRVLPLVAGETRARNGIEELLDDADDYLIVVGALHLIGDNGVPGLLQARGHQFSA